jgi:hypothetical protein
MDLAFLGNVRKRFMPVAQKNRLSLDRNYMICPCNHCKNQLAEEDNVMQSHLLRYGFIKDPKFLVWKQHGEKEPSFADSSLGNSLTTSRAVANDGGQQPSAGATAASGDNASHDYITMADMLEDVADDDGDGNGDSVIDTLHPEDAELLEEIANHMDHDDILFGNPKWLENFREMKQAAMDPLYKDSGKCLEHWTALRFNL